jgi:3-deoxy-7-phosphoheptulonate synthase
MTTMIRKRESTLIGWHPAGWRTRPNTQPVGWDENSLLHDARAELSTRPGLVTTAEITQLRRRLAAVAQRKAVVVQLGDCAETFDPPSEDTVLGRVELLKGMRTMLEKSLGLPVVGVGRIAGQHAKPRSSLTERLGGLEMPSFRGFLINGQEQDPHKRRPDPRRMIEGYEHASATMRLIHKLKHLGMHHRDDSAPHADRHTPVIWTSHEAHALDYEESLVRWDASWSEWSLTSTHFPWIGERTRQPDGAHVYFLAGVNNPIACKLGPTASPRDAVELADILDPDREPGRLTFIVRMGAEIESALPPIVKAVAEHGHPVIWLSDPMHANTVQLNGYKTRHMSDIRTELHGFVKALNAAGAWPGGLHLESTSEDVTECIGGRAGVTAEDIPVAYQTACDPRLNKEQSLEISEWFLSLLT